MRPETRRWDVARDQEVGSHVARDQEVGCGQRPGGGMRPETRRWDEARDQEVG